uniref:Kinase n=1 Tax=Syphacia muris TaxID=451379 RepID=A0A0N5AWU1_9BILA
MVACSVLGNGCHRLSVHIDLNVLSDSYDGENQYSLLDDDKEEDKGGEDDDDDDEKQCLQTALHPFNNQVSGHVTLMCADEFHLFKPYCEREANFYKEMPPEIANFTPAFCGEVKLEMQDGCENFVVSPSTSFTGGRKQCTFCQDRKFSTVINRSPRKTPTKGVVYRDAGSGAVNAINPWAAECRLRKSKPDNQWRIQGANYYIIIENITRFYQFPCVLDLKIGTRQHGDGVNEKKVIRFKNKCERSTSKKYGIRLGGMQYYDSTSSVFQCANKYQGEALSFDQMQECILNFFTDAATHSLRRQLCVHVIKRLEELKKALLLVDGCRLFSASLLIAYDGDPNAVCDKNECVRVCLVDFAHATWKGVGDIEYTGPDDGVILGVETMLSILKAF